MRFAFLIALAILLLPNFHQINATQDGVRILVTFSNLVYDLKLIVCQSDEVDYLVPQGLDPHDYELRPEDLDKLRRADLIVSTGHTPFEARIREMILRGEIGAKLIEIPRINGIIIHENPVTKQPNYHMPIYDPGNYLAFMRELKYDLSELNPSCSQVYEESYERIEESVRELMKSVKMMNVTALLSLPSGQYALEWLGVKVKYLLMKEEGLPASPSELSEIYRAAGRGEIDLIVTVGDEGTTVNRKAIEISTEFGVRKVNIPSPLDRGSFIDKLKLVVESLEGGREVKGGSGIQQAIPYAVLVATLISLALIHLLRRK